MHFKFILLQAILTIHVTTFFHTIMLLAPAHIWVPIQMVVEVFTAHESAMKYSWAIIGVSMKLQSNFHRLLLSPSGLMSTGFNPILTWLITKEDITAPHL
jgi:hypothetical protein